MTINQPLSVELALDVFVIPMLDGVAECAVEGEGLRVQRSIFSRPRERRQLGEAITNLVARYHDPSASDGRVHRLLVLAHPIEERP